MNVYKIICTRAYGGGLAVVAANSLEEALGVFVRDTNSYLDKEEVVCKPLENVESTVSIPSILTEDFYYG